MLLWLAGCATIANGPKAELQIRSEPTDASFELRNESGRVVAQGRTPGVAKVWRSSSAYRAARYDLVVTKDGYLPKRARIQSRLDGWFWIDWILIVPGLLIDPLTGGMWNLIDPPVQVLTLDQPIAHPHAEPTPPP